ncbi:MAG: CPBP family intramembrane metalloprotease [Acidobacteriales bacterium]|nr:CPBP family intramembrane metalloprotease [Terriglobales bacterium]
MAFGAWTIASIFRPGSDASFEAIYRAMSALMLFAIWIFFLHVMDRAKRPIAAMGLGIDRPWLKEFSAGVAGGGVMVAACVAGIAIFGSYHLEAVPGATAGPALTWLWVLFCGAAAEELAFRGYPFQRLVEGAGPVWAIVILSVLFGVIHLGNPNVTLLGASNTILIGIFLAMVFLRTGSLWAVWGVHLGWNAALGMVFGLPVSGLPVFSVVVKGTADGPVWLTGGAYGIEGSATAIVVIAGAIAVLPIFLRNKTTEPDAVPALPGQSNTEAK